MLRKEQGELTPDEYPSTIRKYLQGMMPHPESIGRSGAQVLRFGNVFLKIDAKGTLARAAKLQEYFHAKRLSAPLTAYEQEGGMDYLLVQAVQGACACSAQMLEKPRELADVLGETLRMLHKTDAADCPFCDVNERMLAMHRQEHGSAYAGKVELLQKDVLLHGDCCLPNVFFSQNKFSGLIDLGDAGVGDRHFDLWSAIWSLEYNLETDVWRDRFLDAYGRDCVDGERLAICTEIHG